MATSKRISDGTPDGDYPELWTSYGFVFAGENDYFGFSARNPSSTGANARLKPLYFIGIGNLDSSSSRVNFAGASGASWTNVASAEIGTSYDYSVNVDYILPTVRDSRWYGFSLRCSHLCEGQLLRFKALSVHYF